MQIEATTYESVSQQLYNPTSLPNVYIDPEAGKILILEADKNTAFEIQVSN